MNNLSKILMSVSLLGCLALMGCGTDYTGRTGTNKDPSLDNAAYCSNGSSTHCASPQDFTYAFPEFKLKGQFVQIQENSEYSDSYGELVNLNPGNGEGGGFNTFDNSTSDKLDFGWNNGTGWLTMTGDVDTGEGDIALSITANDWLSFSDDAVSLTQKKPEGLLPSSATFQSDIFSIVLIGAPDSNMPSYGKDYLASLKSKGFTDCKKVSKAINTDSQSFDAKGKICTNDSIDGKPSFEEKCSTETYEILDTDGNPLLDYDGDTVGGTVCAFTWKQ